MSESVRPAEAQKDTKGTKIPNHQLLKKIDAAKPQITYISVIHLLLKAVIIPLVGSGSLSFRLESRGRLLNRCRIAMIAVIRILCGCRIVALGVAWVVWLTGALTEKGFCQETLAARSQDGKMAWAVARVWGVTLTEIYVADRKEGPRHLRTFPGRPVGIGWDGNRLWYMDQGLRLSLLPESLRSVNPKIEAILVPGQCWIVSQDNEEDILAFDDFPPPQSQGFQSLPLDSQSLIPKAGLETQRTLTEMMDALDLCAKAYDAAQKGDFKEASFYYRRAADRFEKIPSVDEKLRLSKAICRRYAETLRIRAKSDREEMGRKICADHVRAIGEFLKGYTKAHEGRFPADLTALKEWVEKQYDHPGIVAQLFRSPMDTDTGSISYGYRAPEAKDGDGTPIVWSYFYTGRGVELIHAGDGFQVVDRAMEPTQVDSLFRLALKCLDEGKAHTAIALLRGVTHLDPKHEGAYLKLGDACLITGNTDGAMKAFRKALSMRLSAEAYDGVGRVLMTGNNIQTRQSIEYFRDALVRNQNYLDAHYHLAQAMWKLKDLDAKQVMDRAYKMKPDDWRVHLLLAEWYQYPPPDLPKAIQWYERYLQVRPDDFDVMHRLGDLYLRNKQYDKARDLVMASLQKKPDMIRELPILAQVYIGKGDIQKAHELFSTYLEKVDPHERAYYEDIRFVATEEEFKIYGALSSPEERREFLRHFWTSKDLTPAEGANCRLLEHYRRVWVARTRYGEKQTPWDRRGEVYIRYGEPDFRSRSDDVDFTKAIYPRVERIRKNLRTSLYGTALPLVSDLPTVDSRGFPKEEAFARNMSKIMDDAMLFWGPAYPVRTMTSLERDETGAVWNYPWMERRASGTVGATGESLVPWESWIYFNIGGGIEITFTDERMDGRYDYAPVPLDIPSKDIKVNLVTHSPQATMQRIMPTKPDDYHVNVSGPLNFGSYSAGFRGEVGKTWLEVYTGIPLSEIVAAKPDSGRPAWVERRVALFDTTWREVARAGDTLSVSAREMTGADPGAFVPDVKAFDLPPGDYYLAVQVADKTTNRMQAYRQKLRVERYGTDSLQVSDIELAGRIEPGTGSDPFVKNGLRVLPMPSRTYRQDQSLFLYCEVYNLKMDATEHTRYRVDYTVRSKDENVGANILSALGRLIGKEQRKGEITVSYEFMGTRPAEFLHVELRAQEVGLGDHVLRVVITDLNSEARAERETTFWIQK